MNFRPFTDINELLDWLKQHEYVYYHAPMDYRPVSVRVQWYKISNDSFEACMARLWTNETKGFTVRLTEHFDRFRVREESLDATF